MNKRMTNEFLCKYKEYEKDDFNISDLYIYSQMLRKELLSDILEFESLLVNKLIESFNFFDLKLIDLKHYIKYRDEVKEYKNYSKEIKEMTEPPINRSPIENQLFEIGLIKKKEKSFLNQLLKGNEGKIISDLKKVIIKIGNSKTLVDDNKDEVLMELYKLVDVNNGASDSTILSELLISKSFGGLMDIIMVLNRLKVIEIFNDIWNMNHLDVNISDSILSKEGKAVDFEINKMKMNNYIKPVLIFMKEIRNTLAHEDIPFSGQEFFNLIDARKVKFSGGSSSRGNDTYGSNWKTNKLIPEIKKALFKIHDKSFYERFIEKLNNNPKIENKIISLFEKDTIWAKL